MLGSKNRISSSCADELRAAISGRVALPGHELYDEGARVWNGAARRRPAIVAFCKQPEDVQAAVRAARRHGLPLSVRGGGHDWAGRALRDGGLVIDLAGMRDVTVDPRALVATVAGGALAKDVAAAAGAHVLVAALGNCGTVGMAGLTLGGGYGPLGVPVGMMSGPDGEPVIMIVALWNGDRCRGERVMGDVQAFGTPQSAQVGPATYAEMLAQFDAWVAAADGCHWEIRTRWLPALTAGAAEAIIAAMAARRRRSARSLAPLPRRRNADGAGWRRIRPAPRALHGGDHRGLEARWG